MALLLLLRALKERKEKGQDCDALLQELQRRLEPLALRTMRRMVSGQMAEEQAILNTALYSIFTAVERFRGVTEAEAVSYCKKAVTTKTLDHIRREKGRLVYIGGETSLAPDQDSNEEPAEAESLEVRAQPEGSDPETLVTRKEVWQRVREALNRLSPLERWVVEQVEVHGKRITDLNQTTEDWHTKARASKSDCGRCPVFGFRISKRSLVFLTGRRLQGGKAHLVAPASDRMLL